MSTEIINNVRSNGKGQRLHIIVVAMLIICLLVSSKMMVLAQDVTNNVSAEVLEGEKVKQIDGGSYFMTVLKENGEVWVWGSNSSRITSITRDLMVHTPTRLSLTHDIVKMAASREEILAVTAEGKVIETYGDRSTREYQFDEVIVDVLCEWSGVTYGVSLEVMGTNIAIGESGKVYAWGKDYLVDLPGEEYTYVSEPILMADASVELIDDSINELYLIRQGEKALLYDKNHTMTIEAPLPVVLNLNDKKALVDEFHDRYYAKVIALYPTAQIDQIAQAGGSTLVLDDMSNLTISGKNYYGELANEVESSDMKIFEELTYDFDVQDIFLFGDYTLFSTIEGSLYYSGSNMDKNLTGVLEDEILTPVKILDGMLGIIDVEVIEKEASFWLEGDEDSLVILMLLKDGQVMWYKKGMQAPVQVASSIVALKHAYEAVILKDTSGLETKINSERLISPYSEYESSREALIITEDQRVAIYTDEETALEYRDEVGLAKKFIEGEDIWEPLILSEEGDIWFYENNYYTGFELSKIELPYKVKDAVVAYKHGITDYTEYIILDTDNKVHWFRLNDEKYRQIDIANVEGTKIYSQSGIVVIKSDTAIYGAGNNLFGQFGNGKTKGVIETPVNLSIPVYVEKEFIDLDSDVFLVEETSDYSYLYEEVVKEIKTVEVENDYVVVFPDTGLEEAVRSAVGKDQGDLYLSEVLAIEVLDASNMGVSDLTGIEEMTNIVSLSLGSNEISDVSALKALTSLETLSIYNNKLTSMSVFGDMTWLTSLYMANNEIGDYSELKKMNSLSAISLDVRNKVDLSYVKALENLTSMVLECKDSTTKIELEGFYSLGQLRSVAIREYEIADMEVLAEMINLETLWLDGCGIKDMKNIQLTDSMKILGFPNNELKDIDFINHMKSLEYLSIEGNDVSDISNVENFEALFALNIAGTSVDLSEGSQALELVNKLEERGVWVTRE